MIRRPPRSTLFPYTTALPIFAEVAARGLAAVAALEAECARARGHGAVVLELGQDRGRARAGRLPEGAGVVDVEQVGKADVCAPQAVTLRVQASGCLESRLAGL